MCSMSACVHTDVTPSWRGPFRVAAGALLLIPPMSPIPQVLSSAGAYRELEAPSGSDLPEVVVFFIDAGGGHRNAAQALVAAAEERAARSVSRR